MEEGSFQINAGVTYAGTNYNDCSIRAGAQGLRIDRKEFPRRQLVGAVSELLAPEKCRVSIVKRERLGNFSTISIDVPSHEIALELVRALGLAPEQGALSLLVAQPAVGLEIALFIAVVLVVFCGSFGVAIRRFDPPIHDLFIILLPFGVTLMGVLLSVRVFLRARVIVGIDGVTRHTWRSRKFIAYDKIQEVLTRPRGVGLVRSNGEVLWIAAFVSQNHGVTVGELLYRRIWQAHLAHSELCKKTSTIDDVHTLGARSWVRTLRENPQDRAVGYRIASRTLPHLEDAVVDATQPLQVRVGAAIALRAKGGASAEPRIRAAASASASPKLRVLFEKIAEDASEEELAQRIETLV